VTDVPADLRAAVAERYDLRRVLGRGGMASVYLAYDRKHHRDVALKVVLPGLAASLGVERFLKEIQIAARLTHPHILALYDSGEAGGFLFYVMPYVEGASLRRRIEAERRLGVDQALAIAAPVADALSYAHRMGIYHRDIKPENILFSQGHPIVADFGIAKAISTAGGANLTRTGFPLGTPGYMSPEQAAGLADLDARSDVYSLAVVIYEMVVGEVCGRWPTEEAVRAGRFTDAPPPHRAWLAEAGGDVEAALVRALALRPEARTPTPEALMEELRGGAAPRRRHYSGDEVREIVKRATELEASTPPAGDAMTIGGIEALAGEVGIAPEVVREAAQLLPARPRTPGALLDLGARPRELSGAAAARFDELAYSPWQLMEPTMPPGESWGVFDVLTVVFFSIVTAGILPLVFIGLARTRKRRLRAFFREGVPGTAVIADFRQEEVGFQVKLTRVRYEFEAGGRAQRGSDLALPVIADRWRAGDRIEILYLPERDYDSVIVGDPGRG